MILSGPKNQPPYTRKETYRLLKITYHHLRIIFIGNTVKPIRVHIVLCLSVYFTPDA
jgi:hypothetical protein